MASGDFPIASNAGDGRRTSGGFFTNSNDPWVGDNGTVDIFAWFHFAGVTIPQGATIDVAHITLTRNASGGDAGTVETAIFAIDEDSSAAPTSNTEWEADHANHTTATVQWDFTRATSGTHQTPSIVSIIQKIVDRAGWASGNTIGIHIDDDGTVSPAGQTWEDRETDPAQAAVLHVEWDTVVADPQTVPVHYVGRV